MPTAVFLPADYFVALLLMIASTLCWGSWPNAYKLTRGYRFELFYWDYVIGIVLTSLGLALTLGSTGGPDGFAANVAAADRGNIACALAAGAIWNAANLLLVAGIEMAGMAVAFPLAIGVALVEGVVLSYLLQPKGNPVLLALGLVLATLAIICDGRAYASLPVGGRAVGRKGYTVCLASGALMGLFAPFVTRALTTGHPLTPYSIAVFYTLGALLCCFVVNIHFMRHPLVGTPIGFRAWIEAPARDHLLGVAGGVIWGFGTVFNFVAAGFVGVAIAYAIGQAAPMVAAFWGVVAWNEFRGAGSRAWWSLGLMFGFYVLALAALTAAFRAN
ncbi:MAG TPA: GRP family sugar transporter [Candidatus Cryosericum sp.]|nr:GRP family sugar transporter [Candidatus Cryosericum sp.]